MTDNDDKLKEGQHVGRMSNGQSNDFDDYHERRDASGTTAQTRTDTRRHYEQRPKETRQQRVESSAVRIRLANNRVKSLLIEAVFYEALRRAQQEQRNTLYVLDLGCGKGGDLPKWGALAERANCDIKYFGIDLSEQSVAQLHERFEAARRCGKWQRLSVVAVAGDFCRVEAREFPSRWPVVDIVSAQFSLHYAFNSVASCRALFDNVARFLAHDGQFIATVVDERQLADRLSAVSASAKRDSVQIGNKLFSITMDQNVFDAFGSTSSKKDNRFNLRYTFWLDSCIDNCDEFVVGHETLRSMAHRIGLHQTTCQNFAQVHSETVSSLSDDEREVYELYCGFLFTRSSTL